jgi:iron complex outermembrane recepter protein
MNTTNGYDEGTLRGKLHWLINADLQADLTLMHVNINNGYDAWSIYNTATTYSNQPGRDEQRSNGIALRLSDRIEGLGEVRSITSSAGSAILYSFDGDWGNDTFWGQYAPYDFFQSDNRYRHTFAEDLRLIGDDSRALFGVLRWLAGIYALRLTETDRLVYQYDDVSNGAGSSELDSRYGATNVALYGSLDADLGPRSKLSAGLRVERRSADYQDSSDAATPFPQEINDMVGGNLSWMFDTGQGQHFYTTLARGYKGGGFNIGSQILSEQRGFSPETLWSLESGIKYARADDPLQLQADVFYMRRQHMQVYLSEQLQQNNPLAYVFFTQNAADGENFGLESEGSYRLGEHWQLSGSAAMLHTRYLGVTGVFDGLGIEGRAQPFAPDYEGSLALEYMTQSGLFARLDSHAMGSFYYYTSDAQASRSYHLENLRVGYRHDNWTASIWLRNLFNERYAQNGFYFGLIPPNYSNQAFLDLGDPRQVGLTISYDLPHGR